MTAKYTECNERNGAGRNILEPFTAGVSSCSPRSVTVDAMWRPFCNERVELEVFLCSCLICLVNSRKLAFEVILCRGNGLIGLCKAIGMARRSSIGDLLTTYL